MTQIVAYYVLSAICTLTSTGLVYVNYKVIRFSKC